MLGDSPRRCKRRRRPRPRRRACAIMPASSPLASCPMAVSVPRALENAAKQVDATIAKAIGWLDREQEPDGFWVGMLESNYSMEAEWLLAMHFLGFSHPQTAGHRRHAAESAAAGRLVGKLLPGAARRHQQHGRVLRGAAQRRYAAGRGTAREGAPVDLRARRPHGRARVHALLARAARRVAVEHDAEPAAGGHRESALVVQHIQLRELGARDAAAARRAVGAPRGATAAARPAARRAVPRQVATAWTTACRGAARGCRGAGCSCSRIASCICISGSASRRGAKWRSTHAWAGSCVTKTRTAPGAESSRPGSTA